MAQLAKFLSSTAGVASGGGAGLDVDDVFSTTVYDGTGSTQFIENGIRLGANRGSGASVQFDGDDDRLSFSGQLANASDSKTFTLSAFVYPQHTSDMVFLQYGTTRFIFKVDGSGKLVVQGYNSSGTKILTLESRLTSGGGLVTGGWQHVLVSVDLASTSNRHLYIDDAIPSHVDWDAYTDGSIDFTTSNVGIAGSPTAVQGKQRLSNVYLDFTYRDLTTTSNRRLFIGTDLAPASGQASLNPIIYLPLDGTTANTGVNSGTGGNFTVTGSPTVLTDGGPFAHPDGGEGGLVWIKRRNASSDHNLFDNERGFATAGTGILSSNTTGASNSFADYFNATSTGFKLLHSGNDINDSSSEYVSWTFRNSPMFQVVTWTGTGGSRTLNHNLGSTPGMIIVKDYSNAGENWTVYHRGIDVNGDNAPETDGIYLNTTGAAGDESGFWNDTAPTSTQFTVGGTLNSSFGGGANYVAYLFAHHANDGSETGFGPDGDSPCISVSSYSGNGSSTGPIIDCGFEPQWLMVKCSSHSGSGFVIMDNMRGFTVDGAIQRLETYNSNAEAARTYIGPTSTGFQPKTTDVTVNGSGRSYIYMAIRRGSLFPPDDATKVFGIAAYTEDNTNGRVVSSQPSAPDLLLSMDRTSNNASAIIDRLRGSKKELSATSTDAEGTASTEGYVFDTMKGIVVNASGYYNYPNFSSGHNHLIYGWKRAPSFFDCVCYSGTGSARTVPHGLTVPPEMMWVRRRNVTNNWKTFHSSLGGTKSMELNTTVAAETNGSVLWNSTAPTASVFSLGTASDVNGSGQTFVAYLFASAPGVSFVGSWTGNGSAMTIDCGFSSSARFVLIKRTDTTDNWYIWDSARGIVSGTEPYLRLNTAQSEATGADYIDPHSSGFALPNDYFTTNGATFIFYAIA